MSEDNAKESHPRVFCLTCGGHVGIPGSPAEHCVDTTHEQEIDPWSDPDLASWTRHYERALRVFQEREARRRIPLIKRLRDCGVFPASDGIPSIVPADIDDAHEAADVLVELVTIAETLAEDDQDARAAARARIAELRHALGV